MKIEDLTPRQREVVEATEPVVVVFGGPGSGKTTTALWAGRLALERPGVAPWQRVIFLTFSRTAVGQIARRAPGVFGGHGGRIDIATFHAFAWRLVRAFGRYGGHGVKPPSLESEARKKLLGPDPARLSYDDLIPAALHLLTSRRLLAVVRRRWPLVICDELQDSSDDQWELLRMLSAEGHLLLLGDPNQMIYTFLRDRGVGPKRLEDAKRIASRVIELEPRSHRDPSGVIPAMAEAVRRRGFTDEAVLHAVRTGRLSVIPNVEDAELTKVIAEHVASVRSEGATTIGIFAHSNEGVATLSASLTEAGLDHVLVGLPEAHAEALSAQATLSSFGVRIATWDEVLLQLATFLTACTRGKSAPPLAVSLARGRGLPREIERRLQALQAALIDASHGSVGDLVSIVCQGWRGIGITRGARPWQRASLDFVALARRLANLSASVESVSELVAAVGRRRPAAIVDFDSAQLAPVQLMNFHQTKGREADAVLLAYREGDYLADSRDSEPYEEPSRVLFVSLTRARDSVKVVLPPNPHPLVEPFLLVADSP